MRGEIWFIKLPTDPADKPPRPVVVVSIDQRNTHPRATTVLVVPLSTSTLKDVPTHIYLSPGESGLEASILKAEDVTVVLKTSLIEPRTKLRKLTHTRVCELADKIRIAMGCH
ncbi:MAG: type II toxin-antitoxin system PemK/MazF family toxin [Candidatus Korobacteraceae bacterium]